MHSIKITIYYLFHVLGLSVYREFLSVAKSYLYMHHVIYTLRHKLSITRTLFRVQVSSECHLVILLNFYGVLYTPTPILG